MTSFKKIVLVLVLVIVFILILAFTVWYSESTQNAQIDPVNYGNVYYFNTLETDLGISLSTFIATHPELEFVAFAPKNGAEGYGTIGYYVIFRARPTEAIAQNQSAGR